MPDALVRSAIRADLAIDPAIFAANFDKRPFYIEHNLQTHPLFELSAIAALSSRLPSGVEWNSGGAGAYGKTDATRSCQETILSVAEKPGYVLLMRVERDPI
jgi:hypothetical protein